jgi:hypothetical protein
VSRSHGPRDTLELGGQGVPVAYLKAYSDRFVADYRAGRLQLPKPEPEQSHERAPTNA